MRKIGFSGILAAVLAIPVMASVPAHPGMLNYVEGVATVDGKTVTNHSVGSADVEQGQVLETGKGKAEILLTPGVFLRLGDNSALRMQDSGLANTSVELLKGEALVEATDLRKANRIQIVDGALTATLEKNGLYGFSAATPGISVYDGQATVQDGDKSQELKKGKQLIAANPKIAKFDTKQGDELYRWSDLRSQYLSEASASSARTYLVDTGGWYGGGWYWNPLFGYYSYLPGDGFLYSPFGWGFFAPRAFAYGGGYYGGFRGNYYRNPGFGRPAAASAVRANAFARPAISRPSGGGFSGGARGGHR